MNNRVLTLGLALLVALAAMPSAEAKPVLPVEPQLDCIQVIPWSYLCSGDVDKFVGYWIDSPFAPASGPDCLQVVPWSYLCNGDVDKFVAYYTDRVAVCDSVVNCDPQVCLATLGCPPWYCLHSQSPFCPGPTSQPECLQVYPWSMLCQGDVGGFVDAFVGDRVAIDGGPQWRDTCEPTSPVCLVDCPLDGTRRACSIEALPLA